LGRQVSYGLKTGRHRSFEAKGLRGGRAAQMQEAVIERKRGDYRHPGRRGEARGARGERIHIYAAVLFIQPLARFCLRGEVLKARIASNALELQHIKRA